MGRCIRQKSKCSLIFWNHNPLSTKTKPILISLLDCIPKFQHQPPHTTPLSDLIQQIKCFLSLNLNKTSSETGFMNLKEYYLHCRYTSCKYTSGFMSITKIALRKTKPEGEWLKWLNWSKIIESYVHQDKYEKLTIASKNLTHFL